MYTFKNLMQGTPAMNPSIKIWALLLSFLMLAGCEVKLAPSKMWSKVFKPDTDSGYYEDRSIDLVEDLARDAEEYEINKVVVMDLVDENDQVPVLGEYMSSRVVEAITRSRYFRVAQRGEVTQTLEQLELKPSFRYTHDDLHKIGKALKAQAVVNGKVRDIGTNIDVHLALVDVATGEVISSATQHLNRTRFAVELLRHY
ncbi:MAG: hypothetical protein G3M70_08355 [Candidatus Nitronauta litoralis]|uniref:FlgO domain-containing protein n=1 Tax=Candidatus Nitronauta litoralis TaxID=2705533 RepID=A0A7T0BVY7_9BACT|nr:MAG: hypothetical protein G3M70_08355 [Candidatus Nitronauta litoralis]